MAVRCKDGRWSCYYREKGTGRQMEEYFGRGPEGEAAAWRRNDELGLGRQKRKPDQISFKDLARVYSTSKNFSPNSLKHLTIRLKANILPFFGNRPAMGITDQNVDDYVRKRRQTVKFSTIAREITDIKAILNFAAGRRPPLIPYNPVRDYKKPESDDESIIPPTQAEADAIMAASPPHLVRGIVLSFYLGLRPGAVELMTLTWDRVNWENLTIRVMSAHKGRKISGPKKRDVPIHPDLAADLRIWWKKDKKTGHIVHYYGRPIKSFKKAWNSALTDAGIRRRIRPYDMRHYFITRALEAGADIKALSDIVGSSPTTIMRFYQHVTRKVHRDTIKKIDAVKIPELKPKPRKKKKKRKNSGHTMYGQKQEKADSENRP